MDRMPPSEGGDRGSIPREGTKARLKKCPAALFTLLSGGVCFTQQSETTSRGRGNFRVATRKLSVTSETYDMICPMYVVIFGIRYLSANENIVDQVAKRKIANE